MIDLTCYGALPMFEHILLEPEQEDLLVKLVEAYRNVPREEKEKFLYTDVWDNVDSRAVVHHDGFPGKMMRASIEDIEILARNGLLSLQVKNRYTGNFSVLPLAIRYYEHLKTKLGQPVERIQSTVHEYLSSESFQRAFPTAYRKWAEAETRLWSTDSEPQLSTIGHLCREAMQEFASGLITKYNPPNVDTDPAKTKTRIKAVLGHRASTLGSTEKDFLAALLKYWGTVVDLVQRQVHQGQKEGEPLVWEDGRRVVFQTSIVMFEIAKALARGGN